MIRVREYDEEKDLKAVEEMEEKCDVGTAGATSGAGKRKKKSTTCLYVDSLGDPMCRIRRTPDHVMLVAEYGERREMVGVIRATVKWVTGGKGTANPLSGYVRVAYILGLRVSPTRRRLGIGTKLVESVEEWCRRAGAEYAYMATDRSNSPSLNLFTRRHSYAHFRSPSILVHPVHAHRLPSPSSSTVIRLPPPAAAALYRLLYSPSSSEFFPSDIASVLSHRLTLGTFLALPNSSAWSPRHLAAGELPGDFAIISLWNSKELFRLRVAGGPPAARALLGWARAVDERAPWMRVPSVRDVFRPFGVYLMYGLRMGGQSGPGLMRGLCRLAHNMAMGDPACAAVVAEVGAGDPVRSAVPHWRRFSCDEDVWCMKRLTAGGDDDDDDWVRSKSNGTKVIFVDPREF